MNNKNCFKISEVARLTNTTRQTLIFYDKKDILKPAYTDDNKYRYYSTDQINLIQIINMLKEFGLSLKEIKKYLDKRDKDEMLKLLDDMQLQMEEKIKRTKRSINIIEYKKELIQNSMSIQNLDDILLHEKEAITVYLSHPLTDEDQVNNGHINSIQGFEKDLMDKGLLGFEMDVIVKQEYVNREFDNHISYFCVNVSSLNASFKTYTVPSGLYVTAYNRGRFQSSICTYQRLLDFIEQNNLKITGDAYERVLSNSLTEANDSDYILEISIKVSR